MVLLRGPPCGPDSLCQRVGPSVSLDSQLQANRSFLVVHGGPVPLREEDGSFGGSQPSACVAEVHAMVASEAGLRKIACFCRSRSSLIVCLPSNLLLFDCCFFGIGIGQSMAGRSLRRFQSF